MNRNKSNENPTEDSSLIGTNAYVKLEIMYQEELQCVAMTSKGWRCPKTIDEHQLMRARAILQDVLASKEEADMELLAFCSLCHGYVAGELPIIYSS